MAQHSTTYHFVFMDDSARMTRLPVHSGGDGTDLHGLIWIKPDFWSLCYAEA